MKKLSFYCPFDLVFPLKYSSSVVILITGTVINVLKSFLESNASDYGKPMRMSYSAIADPCLSSECMEQIDKVYNRYLTSVIGGFKSICALIC